MSLREATFDLWLRTEAHEEAELLEEARGSQHEPCEVGMINVKERPHGSGTDRAREACASFSAAWV